MYVGVYRERTLRYVYKNTNKIHRLESIEIQPESNILQIYICRIQPAAHTTHTIRTLFWHIKY